ncbi:MAG: AbrB/MazE/SpoVT family DNA-binding domain-containing protein [Clostridiales bacterium]|nr:AbrB/MazE/SpoVT family DNA-binding domain-containing protein [Clostridiales bacterium]
MSKARKICTIDTLGRIVIPVGVRRELDIKEGERLELSLEKNLITLKKITDSCIFCSSEDNLTEYKDKFICESCLKNIGKN